MGKRLGRIITQRNYHFCLCLPKRPKHPKILHLNHLCNICFILIHLNFVLSAYFSFSLLKHLITQKKERRRSKVKYSYLQFTKLFLSFIFFACAWKFVSWEFCKLENVICWEVRSEMRKKGWRIWWNSKFYGNIQTSCTSQKCWNFPKISSGWRFYEVKRSDEFPVLLKYVVLSEKSMLRVEKFKIPLVSNSSISWKHEK